MNRNPISRIGKLQAKFRLSGLDSNPVISDSELNELACGLLEMNNYCLDRGDNTMAFAFLMEKQDVDRMVWDRHNH